jgi:hypothetical protein
MLPIQPFLGHPSSSSLTPCSSAASFCCCRDTSAFAYRRPSLFEILPESIQSLSQSFAEVSLASLRPLPRHNRRLLQIFFLSIALRLSSLSRSFTHLIHTSRGDNVPVNIHRKFLSAPMKCCGIVLFCSTKSDNRRPRTLSPS